MRSDSPGAMNAAVSPAPTNVCPQCGAQFRCGMEGGDATCWCASLPPLLPVPPKSAGIVPAASCLCPACLATRLDSAARKMDAPG
ncbi:MAG: cysteine-rich CWC family protein [Sulfuritalea sp.]|nr:cysteine-rich CWC family protein [Sulfuritalea sp.]